MNQRITALVGGQFGSEGKGLIAEKICMNYPVHVRTGAPNAGHTYYVNGSVHDHELSTPPPGEVGQMRGRIKIVARSVPCGAANPDALLIIGAGALIDLELLLNEVSDLDWMGLEVSKRLVVDEKAMLIDPIRHHRFEGGVEGQAHQLIGSTGEGVGPARMAKISRGTMRNTWAAISSVSDPDTLAYLHGKGIATGDTAGLLNDHIDGGSSVLLEGTQGSGLSLTHGSWPYVTSTDTNAAQMASDAGIAPQLITDTILVCRTFPIRVAGNSGPLPEETSWEEVGQPKERTTVTKKVRRVGRWDDELVRRAIMLNRPSEIALTFADYVHPGIAGRTDPAEIPSRVFSWLEKLEARLGVPISMVGTGPDSVFQSEPKYSTKARFIGSEEPVTTRWPSAEEAYRS